MQNLKLNAKTGAIKVVDGVQLIGLGINPLIPDKFTETKKRSHKAVLVEEAIKRLNIKKSTQNSEDYALFEQAHAALNRKKYVMPKLLHIECPLREDTAFGMQTFYFNESENTDVTILFIHGGGFLVQPEPVHMNFASKAALKLNARIILPLYPKLPDHNYKESMEKIGALYAELAAENSPLIIMGDSAGGGFAAAFCEQLPEESRQPDALILISPWLDLSMNTPSSEIRG